MQFRNRIFLSAFSLLVVSAAASPAFARAGGLWSEHSRSTTPLAQVPDFSVLAERLVPAVVSIQVEQARPMRRRGGSDPYEFFFGPFGDMPPSKGIGTGFVIKSDGLILTNNHVVEGADSIEVTFVQADGSEKTLAAKVLGTAPEYDVALIQTHEDARAAIAYLGDSDRMKIGDWVMAIGNPFGLSHSVSVGIVSAKGRREIAPSGRSGLYDFIQTDASINPGNSGGPLINMKGEVIGINTAINAAGAGIGFAIPINMVKTLITDLKEKGHYTRSWMGIRIQPLTDDLADSFGRKNAEGALVADIVPNSPAAKAGLKPDDIVLSFDGKAVRASTDLPLYAGMTGVGRKVPVEIWRSGRSKRLYVTMEAYPDDETRVAEESSDNSEGLGLTVADVDSELRRRFRLHESTGVIIKAVDRGGVAARAGLMPGDLIIQFNGKDVRRARDFAKAVRGTAAGKILRMKISRGGNHLLVALRKP